MGSNRPNRCLAPTILQDTMETYFENSVHLYDNERFGFYDVLESTTGPAFGGVAVASRSGEITLEFKPQSPIDEGDYDRAGEALVTTSFRVDYCGCVSQTLITNCRSNYTTGEVATRSPKSKKRKNLSSTSPKSKRNKKNSSGKNKKNKTPKEDSSCTGGFVMPGVSKRSSRSSSLMSTGTTSAGVVASALVITAVVGFGLVSFRRRSMTIVADEITTSSNPMVDFPDLELTQQTNHYYPLHSARPVSL